MKLPVLVLFCTLILLPEILFAQEPLEARPSPFEMVSMKYEDTYVKITYGRPHKRGREIFGNLVPYGEIWRTGANEATEITITKPINMAGNELAAGTYTIFSIPNEKSWTIILNTDLGQWGAYKYQEKLDALRFDIESEKIDQIYEPFTIEFEQEEQVTNLLITWETTRIRIPLEFYH